MGTVEIVTGIVALMLIAALVRGAGERAGIPVSVLLFVVGLLLALAAERISGSVGLITEFSISSELVLFVFLPTLIFESAVHFDVRSLGKNIGPILMLAVPGLVLSTFAVGGIVASVTGVAFATALLLGAILSATDPVAVLSVFQKLGAPKRLNTLVEGESLLNDAGSLVLSKIIAGVVVGGALTVPQYAAGVGEFFLVFLGGALVGLLLGGGAILLLRVFSTDSAITITVTTILAYLSFVVAEHFLNVSGVIATVTAGLVFGNRGWMKLPTAVRSYVEYFWGYIAFLANALLFLLMGLRIDLATLVAEWRVLLAVIAAILIARAAVVFVLLPLYEVFRPGERVSRAYKVILIWGGLRGAVPIAIVLGLTSTVGDPLLVTMVFGAVIFTLLFHGLTIQPLVKALGLTGRPLADELVESVGRLRAKERGLEAISSFQESGAFSPRAGRESADEYRAEVDRIKARLSEIESESRRRGFLTNLITLQAMSAETSIYHELFDRGHVGEVAFRQLTRQTELQAEKIRGHGGVHDVRYGVLHPKTIEETARGLLDRLPGCRGISERWRRRRLAIDYEVAWGHHRASGEVLEYLDGTEVRELFPAEAIEEVRRQYRHWNTRAREYLDDVAAKFPEFVGSTQTTLARRLALLAELREIEEQGARGFLPKPVADRVHEEVATEIWRRRSRETAVVDTDPSELLRTVPLFSQLPEEEFAAIAERMRPRTVTEGETVVRQGERGSSLYLIARGVVRVTREDGEQRTQLATLMAGDFFGEMAVIRETERTATVRAVSNGLLYSLDRTSVFELFDRYPAIRDRVEEAERRRRGA